MSLHDTSRDTAPDSSLPHRPRSETPSREGDVLARLKAETGGAHRRLDAMLPVMSAALTIDQYRRVLVRLHGYYAPLEARLRAFEGWPVAGLRLGDRLKLPLLERDLAYLGMTRAERAVLPRCDALPPLRDGGDALGILYVLESATLGGQLVAPRLDERLGLEPGRGGSFFASYGPAVGAMWKRYRAAVRAWVRAGGDAPAVIAAAGATFASLERWLGGARREV